MAAGKRRWLRWVGLIPIGVILFILALFVRVWVHRAEHRKLRDAEVGRAPVAAPKRSKTVIVPTRTEDDPSVCLRGQVLDRGIPVPAIHVMIPDSTGSVTGPCSCKTCGCPDGLKVLLENPRAGLLLVAKSEPTKADGTFSICGLTLPLPSSVWAEHADGRVAVPSPEVSKLQLGGATVLEVVTLVAFTGVVKTVDGPLKSARVLAYSEPSLMVRDVTTDGAGRFSMSLPQGNSRFVVAAPNRAPVVLARDVEAGRPVVLMLDDTFNLVIRAVLDDVPVPAAEVALEGQDVHLTDAKGEVHLSDLTSGDEVTVRVTKGPFVGKASVLARAGSSQRLDVLLRRGLRVRGVVIDEKGEPRIGRVQVGPPPLLETDAQGRFESAFLAPNTEVSPSPVVEGCEAERVTTIELADTDVTVMLKVRCEVTATGTVLDADGAPIANAGVLLQTTHTRESASTDAAGRFLFHQPPGQYRLVVSHPRYRKAEQPLTLPTKSVTVVLDSGGSISGKVVDGKGRPIASAEVMAWPSFLTDLLNDSESGKSTATTDVDGAFQLTGLLAGRWVVGATGTSLPSTSSEPVVLHPGEHRGGVVITMDSKVDLWGVVRDEKHQAIAGARVGWDPADEKTAFREVMLNSMEGRMDQALRLSPSSTFTDIDGAFELRGLPLADVKLDISAPGFEDVEKRASRGDRIEVTLKRVGGRIKGRVVDEAGKPVRQFRVDGSDFTGDDGRFEVVAVSSTEMVRVTAEGYLPMRHEVVMDKPLVEVGDLRLKKGLSLRVEVLGENGTPLDGVRVEAVQSGEGDGRCSTRAEGRCVLAPLLELDTLVNARKDGFVPAEAKVERGRFAEGVKLVLKAAGGQIKGQVFGAPGRPAGARNVVISSDLVTEFVLTDETGSFSKAGLPEGDYCASVELSGMFGTDWAIPTRASSSPASMVLGPMAFGATLETTSKVPGRVVLVQGTHPALKRSHVGSDSSRTLCASVRAPVVVLVATGSVRVEGLSPGRWSVYSVPISDADDEGDVTPQVVEALANGTTRVP
jgi:protocatechuate 3,4-dioxygenase beta subunit